MPEPWWYHQTTWRSRDHFWCRESGTPAFVFHIVALSRSLPACVTLDHGYVETSLPYQPPQWALWQFLNIQLLHSSFCWNISLFLVLVQRFVQCSTPPTRRTSPQTSYRMTSHNPGQSPLLIALHDRLKMIYDNTRRNLKQRWESAVSKSGAYTW